MRSQWGLVVESSRQRNDTTYPGFGLEGRLPVGMGEGLHDRIIVIRSSIQKFTADLWRAKKLFPAICMLDDVFSQCGERIRFRMPNPATYTTRQRQRGVGERRYKGRRTYRRKMPRVGSAHSMQHKALSCQYETWVTISPRRLPRSQKY